MAAQVKVRESFSVFTMSPEAVRLIPYGPSERDIFTYLIQTCHVTSGAGLPLILHYTSRSLVSRLLLNDWLSCF